VNTLLVDQGRFDDRFVPPAFDQQPSEWATFRAPVSAIAVERNTLTMNVAPEQDGVPARLWFQPAGMVQVSGQVATKRRGSGQNVQLDLSPAVAGLVAKIGGHVAEGLPRLRFAKRVDDPRLMPGLVLKALLERRGTSVGTVALGGAEQKERITFNGSDPLFELLNELGKNSDNFYAETVFKAVGGHGSPGPATWEAAASAATRWLQANGALAADTRIQNGSGLFDANRLSAETLCSVLTKAFRSPRLGSEFVSHLAIGGVDGTLRSRFRSLKESRQVRAKTGTLARAAALSGYVLRPNAPPFVFSFLVDDLPGEHAAVRSRIDEIVTGLAAL
jgi:D-alanyl-D-alanine carboxypeptidase/D-alanyl-D-alanine-endopeptidase (penicillin-binding protein 4)